jgi:hypothetical protein
MTVLWTKSIKSATINRFHQYKRKQPYKKYDRHQKVKSGTRGGVCVRKKIKQKISRDALGAAAPPACPLPGHFSPYPATLYIITIM